MTDEPAPIGGFFPLELPSLTGPLPPTGATLYRSGRACLAAILQVMRPSRLWAPFYICDSALEPAHYLGVPVSFYPIDEQLAPMLPEVAADECVMLVDYFGVCGRHKAALAEFGARGISDETHALLSPTQSSHWQFTSARKWFGVPDGAFLFGPQALSAPSPVPLSASPEHLLVRRWGDSSAAYPLYVGAEAQFAPTVEPISQESIAILGGVSTELVSTRRRENFARLHAALGRLNTLPIQPADGAVPFCYPFLPARPTVREALQAQKLFIPQFWRDCLARSSGAFAWELSLAERLLPLPIDHRYGAPDMDRLIQALTVLAGGPGSL